ncbi:MAG TPA: ABC transporter permease [Homoserinimonas sp.]|nr:ABC transporter permease [Homoserinimonas sp.]
MFGLILRQTIAGLVLIFVVSAITFALIYSDGDRIARVILGATATEEQVSVRAEQLGLHEPLPVQFVTWLGNALSGDLGRSLFNNEPVIDSLMVRIPVTLSLVIGTLLVTLVLSFAFGLYSAYKGGWVDTVLQFLGVVGFAMPNFLVAILLVVVFSISLKLLPATGYVPPSQSVNGWLIALILPVAALASGTVAAAAQQIRGAVIDVLRQDYIRTLRSRGIPRAAIYLRHALKNASGPGLTIISLQFIGTLGGAVVIERVFALPGLGTMVIDSALRSDIPVIMGVVLFTVVVVVIVNLVVDLVIAWTNPKVRLS